MSKITAVFFDVGGVLLTNGWDRDSRRAVVDEFKLDWDEFEDRHQLVVTALETGQLDLEHYLDRTVFYRQRPYTREQVRDFMFAQSKAFPDSLALVARLAQKKQYLLSTLNNESRELNLYRIQHFGLRSYFTAFFSSCFLGVKKPDEAIYKLALELTQRAPQESVFVDDRPLNLECARLRGMHTIQFQNANQLETDLRGLGLEL